MASVDQLLELGLHDIKLRVLEIFFQCVFHLTEWHPESSSLSVVKLSLYLKWKKKCFKLIRLWTMMQLLMVMETNGNIFRVTGPLWGKSTGHQGIPLTNASDPELWCFLWSAPKQTVEQTMETPVTGPCEGNSPLTDTKALKGQQCGKCFRLMTS